MRQNRISSRGKSTDISLFLRTCCLVLVFSFAFLTACGKVKSEFPTIPTTSSEASESSVEPVSPEVSTIELTVASPLSYSSCLYLAKLYVAKERGMLGDGINGSNVDLDYLDSIDLPFILNVYSTSETGCSMETLKNWKSSGSMPDIYLTDCFDQAYKEGMVYSLTDTLASNPLLSPANLYPDMLSEFYVNGAQYGIPFQAAAHVLFCDMEVLQAAGISAVSFRQSKTTLTELLETIDTLNNDEQTVIPMYLASQLIPFLPCTLQHSDYIPISEGENASNKEFNETISYLSSLVSSGYTYESLSEEEIERLLSGLSPLLSRKVGIWYGSTDEISRYDNYMPYTLSIMEIPGMSGDEYSPPLLTVYPLCVSPSSDHPDEASAFAAFLALDEDAILLEMRLQARNGFLPVVTYPSVWTMSMNSQKYGTYLLQYQDNMYDAIYIPSVSQSQIFQADMDYIAEHQDALLNRSSGKSDNE